MTVLEAIMECQRRVGKSPEYQADTKARMMATPGMLENLNSQQIPAGQEEKFIAGLIEHARVLESDPVLLQKLKAFNRAVQHQQELENN